MTLPLRRLALFAIVAIALAPFSHPALAKKPKKALKEGDARRAIASTPGFGLNNGAVRVREISLAGATPVVVTAEVEVALNFARVEEVEGGGGHWRVLEFRTGDRSWDEFEYLVGPLSAERVESARAALEEAASEFEAKQLERKKSEARGRRREDGEKEKDKKNKEEAGRGGDAEQARGDEQAQEGKKLEVRRGPLVMKEFSPMYKSARAVVAVEGAFRLEKGAGGKWRVVSFTVGDVAFSDLTRLNAAVDEKKAARARADLEAVRDALEHFRRERGFYVVAEEEAVLIDHLSPRYLKTVIRVDPWHRPYRYVGTRERYTLSSDGPDGLPSTPDDVTVGG